MPHTCAEDAAQVQYRCRKHVDKSRSLKGELPSSLEPTKLRSKLNFSTIDEENAEELGVVVDVGLLLLRFFGLWVAEILDLAMAGR